jgi:subfamily B ATP-binding cassette protein MsbA
MRTRSPAGSHDEDLQKKLSLPAVWRVLALAKPYRKILIVSGLLALIASSFQLAFAVRGKFAIDQITSTKSVHNIDFAGAVLAGLLVAAGFMKYLQLMMSAYAGNQIIKELRERLFAHLQRLPVAYFDRARSGDLGSHLSNDVSQLQTTLTDDISQLPSNVFTMAGCLAIALWMNWRLTLIAFGVLALVMLFFVVTGRALRKTNRAALDALADAMGGITEALANIRLVKAFAREPYEDERTSGKLAKVFQIAMNASKLEALMISMGLFGSFLMLVACMWYGARGVVNGTFSIGDVGGFVFVLFVVVQPMSQLAAFTTRLQRAVGASERLFSILDQPMEMADVEGAVDFPSGAGEVRYEDVHFQYVPETPVLAGLSLDIPAGKVTAIVGPSGAGKTTLSSLLYRFYELNSGTISIDGVSITRIKRAALRESIGIVPQDPVLFNGTIRENIRYGRLGATDAEIEAAARDANVEEFVTGFTEGYETQIGERGITLSGGQRQRVAIARAVLKNPKILILDEATSALDNKSEALVREALDRLMENRTTLVIAHRLSTIRRADQIAVVAEGRIRELGTHDELLGKGGAYAELYQLVEA